MMLADGTSFNDLELPVGSTVAFTGNPEDEYDVVNLDDAQSSRAILMAYNRPNEVFYEQCEKQLVHPDLKNFWSRDTQQVDCKVTRVATPPNNDRTKMVYARIYPFLVYDEEAKTLVSNTMFGPEWSTAFEASKSEMRPPEPEEILADFEAVRGKVYEPVSVGRVDITSSMTFRMIAYLQAKGPSAFSDEQYLNFEKFAMMMPIADINRMVTALSDFAVAIQKATRTVDKEGKPTNGEYSRKASEIKKQIAQASI